MVSVRAASEGPGSDMFRSSGLLRASLAASLSLLLAVSIWAAANRQDSAPTVVVVLAIPFAIVAAVGLARPFPDTSARRLGWLILLTALWVALASQEATASYLALVLFVLYLLLLPGVWGPVVTGVVTALAVMLSAAVAGPSTGAILGPVLSGIAAIAIAVAVRSLSAVSESRRQLIDELVRTRTLLAESERQAGIVTERERLAHEIHDTVAQGLSSIQMFLHAAERDIPETSPAFDRVELARVSAAQSLRETRAIIAALQPDDLQEASLSDALSRLAASASIDGLQVDVDVEDADFPAHFPDDETVGDAATITNLPMKVEAGLLRIAQSAVSNVRQHSGADRAKVTLTIDPIAIRLDIVDNGCGFDPAGIDDFADERAGQGHIGMSAMRHRARSIGGSLDVESTPGLGTAVVVTVPRSGTGGKHD